MKLKWNEIELEQEEKNSRKRDMKEIFSERVKRGKREKTVKKEERGETD